MLYTQEEINKISPLYREMYTISPRQASALVNALISIHDFLLNENVIGACLELGELMGNLSSIARKDYEYKK